jgi:hypothetical protein
MIRRWWIIHRWQTFRVPYTQAPSSQTNRNRNDPKTLTARSELVNPANRNWPVDGVILAIRKAYYSDTFAASGDAIETNANGNTPSWATSRIRSRAALC